MSKTSLEHGFIAGPDAHIAFPDRNRGISQRTTNDERVFLVFDNVKKLTGDSLTLGVSHKQNLEVKDVFQVVVLLSAC